MKIKGRKADLAILDDIAEARDIEHFSPHDDPKFPMFDGTMDWPFGLCTPDDLIEAIYIGEFPSGNAIYGGWQIRNHTIKVVDIFDRKKAYGDIHK